MLSIITLVILFALGLWLGRKFKQARWIKIILPVLFNILVIECFAYGYLIHLIDTGNSFFLIGNQKLLDHLIKTQITEAFYEHPVMDNAFYQVDTNIGYTVGRNVKFNRYQSSTQGLRADREYSFLPDKNTLRIATFGDSFVFCDGESNRNTWQNFLEASVGNVEVLNFGVSGYGLGQTYLRYLHDGLKFHPDVVYFNYVLTGIRDITDDDPINGSLNLKTSTVCRPIFRIENDRLFAQIFTPMNFFDPSFREKHVYRHLKLSRFEQILNGPLFSVSNTGLAFKSQYLQKKYARFLVSENPKDVQYNLKMIEDLLNVTERERVTVLFAVDEDFKDLPDEIKKLLIKHAHHVVYVNMHPLIDQNITKLGLTDKQMLNVSNHYTAIGNRLYAALLADIFKSRVWRGPDRIFQYDESSNSFVNVSP